MTDEIIKNLGPLAPLAGVWEGEKGDDKAPDDDRGVATNKFRERITFEPMGPVNNHEQALYGLRYATTAWRVGAPNPFHEELGYWLWDAKAKQVLRCFIVSRGVTSSLGGLWRRMPSRSSWWPMSGLKPMASVPINFWMRSLKPSATN